MGAIHPPRTISGIIEERGTNRMLLEGGISPHIRHKNISQFDLLCELQRFKIVCIQPEALSGCFGEPKAPFRSKGTLPVSLESLTFYGSNRLILDLGLAEQFRKILFDDFTHLKSIVFRMFRSLSAILYHHIFPGVTKP